MNGIYAFFMQVLIIFRVRPPGCFEDKGGDHEKIFSLYCFMFGFLFKSWLFFFFNFVIFYFEVIKYLDFYLFCVSNYFLSYLHNLLTFNF